jgi:hypothetical protein
MGKPATGKPHAADNKVGCLPFLLGAILGFLVVLLWSRSQVYMMGNVVIRGESRSRLVFAYAGVGAIAGGFVVSVISVVLRKWRRRRASQQPTRKDSP